MLVTNNKLEGRIADLFVTLIVDSEAEGPWIFFNLFFYVSLQK